MGSRILGRAAGRVLQVMAPLMCRAEMARRGPVCRARTKCPGATICTSGRDSVTSLCQCSGQRQLLMDRELQGQT